MRVRFGLVELERRDVPATSFTELPILPAFDAATLANVRRIAYRGELNGLRDDVFLKVGDSNTDTDEAFRPLGRVGYDPVKSGLTALGPEVTQTYVRYLAPLGAPGSNSFTRAGFADQIGWTVPQMLGGLDAELATTRAGVALVLAGTNDHHVMDVATFRAHLQTAVDRLAAAGVVPVLCTIPWDRYLGTAHDDAVIVAFNQAIVDLAADNRVPLLNLWRALESLPNNGLKYTNQWHPRDYRHLSSSPNPGGFGPFDLLFGQNVRHVVTLQTLTQLRQLVFEQPGAVPAATPWSPLASGQAVYATSTTVGVPTVVTVADAGTGQSLNQFAPFGAAFCGGASTAVGDVNGDAVPDVMIGAGAGGGPVVTAYSGTDGHELFTFFAYEPEFRGGVSVAVGDADGDGVNELVVGSGPGGGPRVRVFRASDLVVVRDFFAYEPTFAGGVTVAVGSGGLVVGTGIGGGPVVKVFAGEAEPTAFLAYDGSFRGGVSVAVADFNGDGADEIVTGPGPGDTADVRRFTTTGELLSGFIADDPTVRDGASVSVSRGRPPRIVVVTATGVHVVSVGHSLRE